MCMFLKKRTQRLTGENYGLKIIEIESSVSAITRHCGNPALQSEMAPRKTRKGPIWPFSFYKTSGLIQA